MTSTNDGKEVKSYQTSGPKSKTYFIELYKSLEACLSEAGTGSERTKHLCEAWRRVHSLCQHSAPTTHPHLLSWLQRHTARTVLQTKWQSHERKDDRTSLEEAINVFIVESHTTAAARDGDSPPWESELVARGKWFKKLLEHPWKHPVLNCLLNPDGTPPTDNEVLEWLIEERGVTFVMRLHTLVAEKCDDIAMSLATAVMERVRAGAITTSDDEQSEEPKEKPDNASNFGDRLKGEAGFTVEVWEMLTDMEFVLLHKRDSSRCITLAKHTPLRSAYQLIERLQSRFETSPREKRLWKNSKEVAVLIAQVVIARCMVVPQCIGGVRTALYCCARSLARLLPPARLPPAAAALAAPAPTAAHLHTLAAAVDAQLAQKNESGMKPFVCELYVRAMTAGMNELERLKLKTEKETEARAMEQTLAGWLVQLGGVLGRSARVRCECALTAFSVHPSQQMYERIKAAPPLPPVHLDVEQASTEATNPEFGSWASDSRGQSNFVKTSETLNMKARQNQANVLSTAILSEGEALGLSPELCQDITVLLSGPRLKTLSWDMDRGLLLENCRAYLERTHAGTKAVTTELKYLNLNPDDFQYLPEEDDDESNIYYGIEKGYEHLVEFQEPEDIWEDAYENFEKPVSSYSSEEFDFVQPQRRRKTKKHTSNEEDDPLSLVAETKRKEMKERPHSKERSKERNKATDSEKKAGDPLEMNDQPKKVKPKRERKKKAPKPTDGPLASLIGLKVGKSKKQATKIHTDSDVDSQRSSVRSVKSEDNVLCDGIYSMDDIKSPGSLHSSESMQNNEFLMANKRVGMTHSKNVVNRPYRPPSVADIRIASLSPSKSQSPADHSRTNSPTFPYISDDVKSSISKLLEFRRQKAIDDRKKPSAIMQPDGSIAMDRINISPKGVAIPEIPKSYISKQNDKMSLMKSNANNMLDHRNHSSIPGPVIQFASKITIPDKPSEPYSPSQYNNSQADRTTLSDRCFSTPPISDRFLDSVDLISIYDENEETQSQISYDIPSPYAAQDRQSNIDLSNINYNDYLHEFSLSSFNDHMEENDAGMKAMNPISRAGTPVFRNMDYERKTPQSAKQIQQKKPEGSLNTFSRLSYFKNKQTDMKKSQDISQQNQSLTVGSKLDGFIMNHLRSQSAVNPSNDLRALINEYEKPPNARDHPTLTKILERNLPTAKIQERPLSPPKTKLSEKDDHDLLLLLRQQSSLNKPQQRPVVASAQTATNSTFHAPIASSSKAITSSTDYIYGSNASIASSNLVTNSQICKPSKAPNKAKTINVLSNSIIKSADQNTKDPKHKPVSTKKPVQVKLKKTDDKLKKASAKPEPRKHPEEWKNVMNAIRKQKTPRRGPNALDMALNKSSFEKAFEDSLRTPTTLFTKPCTIPDPSDVCITEFDHEKFMESILAANPMTNKIIPRTQTTQPILNIPKRQSVLKKNTKTKRPARPSATTLLKNDNLDKTIGKLMKHNQIEITKRNSSVTHIKIPEMTQKHSLIEKSAKIVPQLHVEMSKKNVEKKEESKLEISKKHVKQNVDETPKEEIKQTVDIQMKPLNLVEQLKEDPFITGIPNSDYDLLDELMDDDLRKEIGELSSDEESYNAVARGFLKHNITNEKNVTVKYNHAGYDIASKTPPVVVNIARPASEQIEMVQSLSQNPMQQPQNNNKPVLVKMTPANLAQNKPGICLNANVNNVVTHVVSEPSQAYNNVSLLRSNQITVEPNIYITAVPRPAPVNNVMLISSGLVYDDIPSVQPPMQTVPTLAPNTYIALNNAPSINVYQATQFAAPVLGPLILTHANVSRVLPVVSNVPCDTTMQPKPVTKVSQTEYCYSSHELHQPSHLPTVQGNIVVDGKKWDAKGAGSVTVVADKADDNVDNSGEKVLKEVQGKHANENIECKRRNLKVGDKDQERLKKKWLSILNRKISVFCGFETIALGYSPLQPSTQKENTELDDTNYGKDDLISSNQNNLQELNDGIKSLVTPDSYKENKNETVQVRRVLLRSSHKLRSKISASVMSPKPSLKQKGSPAISIDTPNETPSENDQSDIETQNKPKRVSKRIRNKYVATPIDMENNKAKVPIKENTGTTKVSKKNVHKDTKKMEYPTPKQDFDTDHFFDIEAELLGSTIPKIIPIGNILNPPEISLPNASTEEVQSLISDSKKDDFSLNSPEISVLKATCEGIEEFLIFHKKKAPASLLPIQEYQLHQGKDLSLNETTKSVEKIKSLKEMSQSIAVSVSVINTTNKTEEKTKINGDSPETTDVIDGNSAKGKNEKVEKENNENINEITVKEIISKKNQPIPDLILVNKMQTNEVNALKQVDSPTTDIISLPRKDLAKTTDLIDKSNGQVQKIDENAHKVVVAASTEDDDDDDIQIVENMSPLRETIHKEAKNTLRKSLASIVIENIVSNSGYIDPLKKAVRIKLRNGKTFKGTISGSVDANDILDDPKVTSMLMSQFDQPKKLYSLKLNVNKTFNGDKILSSQIPQRPKPLKPFETVSLISDDEDENVPQVFETEYGKHKINSMDNDVFKEHKKKLKLKSFVPLKKLSMVEENAIKLRSKTRTKKNVNSKKQTLHKCVILDESETINLKSSPSVASHKINNNVFSAIPSKFIQGIFNDIENILAPTAKQPREEPIVLIDDSSNDSVDMVDKNNPEPKEKIDELKHMLLKDLGVVDNLFPTSGSTVDVQVVCASEAIDLTDDPVVEPIVVQVLADDKPDYQKIINKKCFVKLVRCDYKLDQTKCQSIEVKADNSEDNYNTTSAPVSPCGSFSILDEFPTDEPTEKTEYKCDRSSPVMEIYDLIASLKGKFPTNRNNQVLPSILPLKCDAEWMTTKNVEYMQYLNSLTKEFNMVSSESIEVPKLATLILSYIQKVDLVNRYNFETSCSLKRKTKPASLPIAKISKLVTPADKTRSDDCSRSSTQYDLSATDASNLTIVDENDDDVFDDNEILAVVPTEELRTEEKLPIAKMSKLVTPLEEARSDDCSRSSRHKLPTNHASNLIIVDNNADVVVDENYVLAAFTTEELKTEEKLPIAKISKFDTSVEETLPDNCSRSSTHDLSPTDAFNVTIADEKDDIVDNNDVLAAITTEEFKTEEKVIDNELDITPDLSDAELTNMTVSDCNDIDNFELVQKETEFEDNLDVELHTGGKFNQVHKILNIEKVVTSFRNEDDSKLADAVEIESQEKMIDFTSDANKNDLSEFTENHILSETLKVTSAEPSLVNDIPIDCSDIDFAMKQIEEHHNLPGLRKTDYNSHYNLAQDNMQFESSIKETTISQNNFDDVSNTTDDSAISAIEVTGDLIKDNEKSLSEISMPKCKGCVNTQKKLHDDENLESFISNCNVTNDEEIFQSKVLSIFVKGQITREVLDLYNGTIHPEIPSDKIAKFKEVDIMREPKIIQDSLETCIEDDNDSKKQRDFPINSPTCEKFELKETLKIQNSNDAVDTNLPDEAFDKLDSQNILKLQMNCDKPENDQESKYIESVSPEITDKEDCFDSIATKIENETITHELKQLVENTIKKQETKSKSKATHFPKTNDEIVDALNKMFGEPEVVNSIGESEVVIINDSENKASSLSIYKNKYSSFSNLEQKHIFDQDISPESTKLSEEVHIDETMTKLENSNQNDVANYPQTTDEIVDALKKILGEPEEDMGSMVVSEVAITENYITPNKISTMPNSENLVRNAATEHHDDAINDSLREGLSLIRDPDCETVVESIVEMLSDEIIDDITIYTLNSNTRNVAKIKVDNVVEKSIVDSDILIVAPNDDKVLSILDQYPDSNGRIKGIEYDIGTSYMFSVFNEMKEKSVTYEQESRVNEPKDKFANDCSNDEKIEDMKLMMPIRTYLKNIMVRRSSRNLKRKKDMSDFKTNEKKYRKGKNIDYPKITATSIAELTYTKEYKRVIDYCSTIKFSYARPFHIDYIDVCAMLKSWPINQCPAAAAQNDSYNTEGLLYRDNEDTENVKAITDPLKQTLNEEIVNGETIYNFQPLDIDETNFNKGFGERSGRVTQKIETSITKLSAATLSDVKQYQPFSLSEIKKTYPNIVTEIDTQKVKLSLSISTNFIKVKEKIRSFFKKTAVELNNECLKDKKYTASDRLLSKFPFGLTSSDFMEVPDMEIALNVVQVGQLPIKAAAQNLVTCDPRVTHVSDASPSQCSVNSPGADTQATGETEYTELTTANITLPSMQEYVQNRHQSQPPQEQTSPGTDDDMNASTHTLSIVKIELMEETSQEKLDNGVYENNFSPLPNNNVEYSFEDTSNTLYNTSVHLNNTSDRDNTSNNTFNIPTSTNNSFTSIFNSNNNMHNTYTNMDNTPSSPESTYTNMDNASTSMYSASPNTGNSSTEVDSANMDDASPNMDNTNLDNTAMNTDSASTNIDDSYTNIYNPLGSDSNDVSNTNVGNSTSDINDSPINLENKPINMSTTLNMENSNNIENAAYDYTYENIEDYAANIENNNNANYTYIDNYAANVENYPVNADEYSSNVENYASNDENYSRGVENYASNVENYTTNIENYSTNVENYTTNIDNTSSNIDSNLANIDNATTNISEEPQDLSMTSSSRETKICNKFVDNKTSKVNRIEHAMNVAGISPESVITSGADELANLMSAQAMANSYSKSPPINVMTLQQTTTENQIPNNPAPQQLLHIVQGNNAQTVINKPSGTHLLHIVQNKSNPAANGLSLVDAGLQQGGNQLIHFVNNGNQNNAQFLKRVNLLTNVTNAQGSNEQKMIQFVCKSADGKSIQLNAGHQRSMVLRLHPSAVSTAPKPTEPQDLSASSSAANNQDPSQEIKSRSVYDENYTQFVQSAVPNSPTTPCQEKATSLPKFNQVFGKQSYQENQNEMNDNGLQENSDCQSEENTDNIEQNPEENNPPLLVRSAPPETTQAQPTPTPHVKQTIAPMNIHTTMHGGVIYTRQIPVNIGGGQTINLITVPSTELIDDSPQKQQTDGSFVNQEGEQSSIIKMVPHHNSNNSNMPLEENNAQPGTSNEANYTPQPPPVLTQMRIKLPMLSKGPHIVPGARLVRPSFFQIQRNVIAGANHPVYQQLVLTSAPSLGQAIRLPAQSPQPQPIIVQTPQHQQSSPHIPVQQVQHAPSSQHLSAQAHAALPTTQSQSAPKHTKPGPEPNSELSTLTLEQLREFDMVLEQVKERSVHPTPSTTPITKPTPADSTDGPALSTTSVSESTQKVLYSAEKNQPTNVVSYVNRKSTITSATTSFVRSPDSSGIVDTPSSSTQVHITHTVTSKSSTAEGASAVVPRRKKKKKKKSSSSALSSLGSSANPLKPQEDEQTTQRILYILAEYKEQVENSPDKNKPAPRRRNQFPPTIGGSKRKRSHCSSRGTCGHELDTCPIHGELGELGDDSLITLGSDDSSCGTTFSECMDCQEGNSNEDTTKVVRSMTFEQETTTQITQSMPPRNVIVGDRQTITVARTTTATTTKPTATVFMPTNYILPVSMLKGGQQIAIMTNRGPKILVGAGDNNAGALLFQRLIGPGLKPVLTRPGVRHIRLPATALHNLQAFNLQTTPVTQAQPPDSTATHAPTPAPPDLVDTQAMSSPWQDGEAQDKPDRGPSPDCTEPWNLPSSSIADDYGYEEIVRTDNMERTVLDAIPDRYSPDMEAQRILDKMFDVDSKKSMYDSSRCGYDIDTSDGDDKPYPQVVQQRKDGRHHRVTHVSTAALRHKYAILEHELRLQKSLSEECEDLGVDSPSASELFPEADILFGAPSPAHEQTIDQCSTPPPDLIEQSIPQPNVADQIATDQLLNNGSCNDDLDLNLDGVGEIVTVGEDGIATVPTINAEEFARSHPNTTFHTEPEDAEIPPYTITQGIKGRHITYHANRVPGTVVMPPQTTVISQATMNSKDGNNTVKFIDIDNMINSMPCPQPASAPSVLVKDPGVTTKSVLKSDSRKDKGISASRSSSKIVSRKESGSSHRSNKIDNLKESGSSHRSNKIDSRKEPGSSHRSNKMDSLKEPGTSHRSARSYSKFDSLKDSGNKAPKPLSKFDSLLTDSKLQLSKSARQVVHPTSKGTQVIRRLRYDEKTNTKTNTRHQFEEPRRKSISDEVKMRNDRAIVESMGDNASSPGQPELFWDSTTKERHEKRFHFSETEKVAKSPFDELLNDSSAYGPHTRLDSVIKAARPKRTYERTSFEGISASGSSDDSRPLRTYPPKRLHTQHTQHTRDNERHFTLKTTTTTTHHHELTQRERSTTKIIHHEVDRTIKKTVPRCQEEGRRRTGRGLVKRGCSCCSGSSVPPKKRSRAKKPNPECTMTSKSDP